MPELVRGFTCDIIIDVLKSPVEAGREPGGLGYDMAGEVIVFAIEADGIGLSLPVAAATEGVFSLVRGELDAA